MPQAFYLKWRPIEWDQVVAQDHVTTTLRNAVAADRVAHAQLFAGPRGTGKTTTARLLAKAVNCLAEDLTNRPCNECEHCAAVNAGRFLDLIEIDAASNTSVDDVRDLRDKINFSPNQGRYKVYVIDEVHMLSTAAFNALLKTLEEPPRHAIFILATTEVHKIPATVLSRCQRHEFRRIPVIDINTQLQEIVSKEDIQAETAALNLIAHQATGSMRDAISLLDQLASTGKPITLELAHAVLGTATNQAVLEVVDAIVAKDPAAGLEYIHRALDAGSDPRQFARQIVDYLRDLLLVRANNADQIDAAAEIRAQMARHAQAFSTPELLSVIRSFNQAASNARSTWQPALPLEMAFIETLEGATQEQTDHGSNPKHTALPSPPSASLVLEQAKPQPAKTSTVTDKQSTPSIKEADSDDPQDIQTLKKLDDHWDQILQSVKRANPNTYGLLNSAKSRQVKGNLLILGFASDVLKNQMNKQENVAIVSGVMSQVLAREIEVRCTISVARGYSIPPEVDNNGMVAAALRDLGGEIVDVQ
jgi:DNA polymerase-3 subunit gamma/tau